MGSNLTTERGEIFGVHSIDDEPLSLECASTGWRG